MGHVVIIGAGPAGLALAYPVIRSRPLNLGVTAQFEAFTSTVDTDGRRQSRDAVRALRLGVTSACRNWCSSR